MLTLRSSGQEPCRLEYQLIQCNELLYIIKVNGHQVRPVFSYWLLANAADRHAEDCDGHVYSFTSMPIGSLGEDLENIIIWLALNDELGTWYLSSLSYQGSFIIDKTHIQC